MAMTVETAQLNNQSILQNFGLVEEMDEQAAEIISGGSEEFTIRNNTRGNITYNLDGYDVIIQPGEELYHITYEGIIDFNTYSGSAFLVLNKSYNLSDGQVYEFQNNYDTANSYDIDLYPVYS
ncbi:hypothetical protein NSTC745_04247 [Nostoc sp. DSM 114161]|jgi:hypothetical protein